MFILLENYSYRLRYTKDLVYAGYKQVNDLEDTLYSESTYE